MRHQSCSSTPILVYNQSHPPADNDSLSSSLAVICFRVLNRSADGCHGFLPSPSTNAPVRGFSPQVPGPRGFCLLVAGIKIFAASSSRRNHRNYHRVCLLEARRSSNLLLSATPCAMLGCCPQYLPHLSQNSELIERE
jgi:hypothetical protein